MTDLNRAAMSGEYEGANDNSPTEAPPEPDQQVQQSQQDADPDHADKDKR